MIGDVVGEFLGGLVGGSIGDLFGDRRGRRRRAERERRAREQGRVHASVRVVHGTVPGLGRRWWTRTWGVRPGALTCRAAVLVVDAIDPDHRRPTFRESWGATRGARIHAARSGAARVELAVTAGQGEWTLDTLARFHPREGRDVEET